VKISNGEGMTKKNSKKDSPNKKKIQKKKLEMLLQEFIILENKKDAL